MIIDIPPTRGEWLALRRKFIGGSEIAALFNMQPDYAPSTFSLWQDRAGRALLPEIEDNARMRWGRMLEADIAQWAAEANGWHIETGGFAIDDTCPGLSATLDYRIVAHTETEPGLTGPGVIECKAVDWLTWTRGWGRTPTLSIELQLQHQLAATGWEWGAICVSIGMDEPTVFKRKARPDLVDAIRAKVSAFWASVEAGTPPEVDDSDSTAATLRALYPVVEDKQADIPEWIAEDLHRHCSELVIERETVKAADKRAVGHRNYIKSVMQDANSAFVPAPDFDSPAFWISQDTSGAIRIRETAPT